MASFTFNRETGEESKKEKLGRIHFGFNRFRNIFVGGSVTGDMNTNSPGSNKFNKQGHIENTQQTSHGHKHIVTRTHSCNPMPSSQHGLFERQKKSLDNSSSVSGRENMRPVSFQKNSKQTPRRHSDLAFSKSLPNYDFNKPVNHTVCESEATQSTFAFKAPHKKIKLSRSGQQGFFNQEEVLRKKAQTWRNDLEAVKKRRNENSFNLERDFDLDDQFSLKSESNPEDHIYEEIDSDIFTTSDDEKDQPEDNFLLNISLERQNNLKFYGCASWDFGS